MPDPKRRVSGNKPKQGFTLLEIMIVVAIIGVIMAMSAPSFTRPPAGIQRGLSEFFEACRQVRANAIISGQPAELIIHPGKGLYEVTGPTPMSGKLPDGVRIELLGVNFIEMQNAESARVKFQPNATCDEFTMVLISDDGHGRKISMEVTTGLVDVEEIR